MKAKILLLFLAIFGFGSITFSQKDWRGTYKFQKGEGLYEIEIYGPPGELEGDFKYTGEGGSYKISLNLKVDGEYLRVEAVKVWEGKYHSESKIMADKLMLRFVYADGKLITEVGSHSLSGYPPGHQEELFKKEP